MSDEYSYASILELGSQEPSFSFDKCAGKHLKAHELETRVKHAKRMEARRGREAHERMRDYEYIRDDPDKKKVWDNYNRYVEAHKAWVAACKQTKKLQDKLERAWEQVWDCEQDQYKPDNPYDK